MIDHFPSVLGSALKDWNLKAFPSKYFVQARALYQQQRDVRSWIHQLLPCRLESLLRKTAAGETVCIFFILGHQHKEGLVKLKKLWFTLNTNSVHPCCCYRWGLQRPPKIAIPYVLTQHKRNQSLSCAGHLEWLLLFFILYMVYTQTVYVIPLPFKAHFLQTGSVLSLQPHSQLPIGQCKVDFIPKLRKYCNFQVKWTIFTGHFSFLHHHHPHPHLNTRTWAETLL